MRKITLNKNFTLFILGRLVSLIGSGIQMIAIPLYILDKTGSGTAMGIFTLLGILPRLLAAPFSGVIGDRFNRKNIMVLTDFIRGILIILLYILSFRNMLQLIILFIIQAIVSVLDGFFGAATSAMLPDIVSEEQLRRANSILGTVNSFSMIIGPILGGVIYGFFGISLVFLFNGISFILSAISEMFIEYNTLFKTKEKLSAKSFFIEFKEGLVFIVKKRSLKILFTFAMFTNFLIAPLLQVVEPYILRQIVKMSAQQYGLVQTFFTIGMLLGNIALISFFSKMKNKPLMIQGLAVEIALLFIFTYFIFPDVLTRFSTLQFFWLTAAIYFTFGFFNVQVNVPISTNLQLMTPSDIRSRVFSTLEVFSQIMVPLGAVIYGFLLDHIAAHFIFLFATILTSLITFVFLLIAPKEVYEPKTT
ncbi:MFS transporter [Thermosipho melanesiensis]|uniref:Major facilitator superfamily MFS_1 n=2 Tax=Thermosipho melanesiensis TaxID=46541 RepID=A6LJY7_THEM4|nr:MFS transporter [Thermosipho melanesiensis]ABR30238.1 major facilitator superfamily MFS_1 [Thermosipho melanesiensis BI429]APT73426.1 MFS transporter [Thermosipho melanesiensis]OOC37369.1 MFS transporter [Thermosipho melanesiensis]OOC39731.1 MFS transporter [Thermosipho melanesiensis]OOC39836.1 MFS transporter [Thermosipho melanesiensis]